MEEGDSRCLSWSFAGTPPCERSWNSVRRLFSSARASRRCRYSGVHVRGQSTRDRSEPFRFERRAIDRRADPSGDRWAAETSFPFREGRPSQFHRRTGLLDASPPLSGAIVVVCHDRSVRALRKLPRSDYVRLKVRSRVAIAESDTGARVARGRFRVTVAAGTRAPRPV